MTQGAYDVVIIGGGIIGAACALECVRANLSVAVVEPSVIGGGATAAGMGHIVVMDDSEAQFALTSYSRQLWMDLAPELPSEVEYVQCGTVWVAADEEEMREVHRKHSFYKDRGVSTVILDESTLHENEPNLRCDLAGGLLVPDDAVLYSPCAARHLLNEARQKKCELIEEVRASKAQRDGVQLSDGTFISCGAIVNAAGTWASDLAPGIEVRKRKGHLIITDRYPGYVSHQLIELGYLKSAHAVTADSVAFNVQPRITGQLLIGSSRQFGAENTEVDIEVLRKMVQRACEYMPGLSKLSAIRTWTGFRAATPDKLPLIGKSPAHENLYLATGHEGLGITTSLATARLLVDQLLGRSSAIPVEPYLPSRSMEVAHA